MGKGATRFFLTTFLCSGIQTNNFLFYVIQHVAAFLTGIMLGTFQTEVVKNLQELNSSYKINKVDAYNFIIGTMQGKVCSNISENIQIKK